MELRPLAVTIPRVAPVAVITGTVFLELAARLLPLRLRFLITSVLRDRGRVTPWSFCQGEKIRFSIIQQSLLTSGRTLTKNKPQALHSGWPCGSRLQRGVVAVLQFVHCVCPSPPVGDIPPMETLPDPPEAAATTVASPDTDNLRSTVTPPDVPMLVLPLLCSFCSAFCSRFSSDST